jgi:hypothetical protein
MAFPSSNQLSARSLPQAIGLSFSKSNDQIIITNEDFMNTYTAAIVADATGASLATLIRYGKENTKFQPCDKRANGSGERNLYSTRRVMQIALTVECSRLGIAPSRGGKAAFEFSDRGNPGRDVGELYPLGATLIVGLATGENNIVNVPPDLSVNDVLSNDTAAFIINCNNVVSKVMSKLSKQ